MVTALAHSRSRRERSINRTASGRAVKERYSNILVSEAMFKRDAIYTLKEKKLK